MRDAPAPAASPPRHPVARTSTPGALLPHPVVSTASTRPPPERAREDVQTKDPKLLRSVNATGFCGVYQKGNRFHARVSGGGTWACTSARSQRPRKLRKRCHV